MESINYIELYKQKVRTDIEPCFKKEGFKKRGVWYERNRGNLIDRCCIVKSHVTSKQHARFMFQFYIDYPELYQHVLESNSKIIPIPKEPIVLYGSLCDLYRLQVNSSFYPQIWYEFLPESLSKKYLRILDAGEGSEKGLWVARIEKEFYSRYNTVTGQNFDKVVQNDLNVLFNLFDSIRDGESLINYAKTTSVKNYRDVLIIAGITAAYKRLNCEGEYRQMKDKKSILPNLVLLPLNCTRP